MSKLILTTLSLISATLLFAQPQQSANNIKIGIIAHRGYWKTDSSAQNSIASLEKAQQLGIYGSEFDVNLTKEGELVVCHGPAVGKIKNIQYADMQAIGNESLENGEKVPLLRDYLIAGKKSPGTKLILEIKAHDNTVLESEALQGAIKEVKRCGVKDQVEFISFSVYICKELKRLMPKSKVSYLGGEIPPKEIKGMGLDGIDYNYKCFIEHTEWVKEAHDNGLTVNVWTVDTAEQIKKMIEMGVDLITTNEPVIAATCCSK
jgi:glycerophosphoryl diester phosphodiesterase